MVSEAHAAIAAILHDSVLRYSPKNSKLVTLQGDPFSAPHTGTIFGFRDKTRMTVARGVILRSIEALDDNEDKFTHWTPNPYRFGKKTRGGTVSGFREDNLMAINTFMIDIDFKTAYERDCYARQHDITWDTIINGDIFPALILQTDKGYQAYYLLDAAVYVRRNTDGRLPVVESAKLIAKNLKECLAKKLPQVDQGANSFGIARIPRNDSVVWFEPRLVHRFENLKQWSIRYSQQKRATTGVSAPKLRLVDGGKQIDQPWFGQVLRCTTIRATGKGGGVGRHNVALTLALACYQSDMDQDACGHLLDEWNTRLEHPQDPRDVANAVRDAYSGRYRAASPRYIREISANWFDGKLPVPASMWYKFARPREERKYSHTAEWAADILAWFQAWTGRDGAKWTVRQLMAELELSKATLERALALLRAQNKITVVTQLGCAGYTLIQTAANIYKQLVAKRMQAQESYGTGLDFVADWPTELPGTQPPLPAEIIRQIDLFFDKVDPPDSRRSVG